MSIFTSSCPYTCRPGHAFHISFLFLYFVLKAGWLLVYTSFNIVISSIRSFFYHTTFECFLALKAQGHQKTVKVQKSLDVACYKLVYAP